MVDPISNQLKKILVPLDFSETSVRAMNYAASLAFNLKSEIILFHTVVVPVVTSGDMVFATDVTALQNDAIAHLEKAKAELLSQYTKLTISINSTIGVPANEINLKCKNDGIDMVIMGSNGTSGMVQVVFGSVTRSVIANCPCPVLTVPINAPNTYPGKVAFATNFDDHELQSLFLLTEMLRSFGTEIHLIHVGNGSDMKSQDDLLTYFRGQVRANINYENIKYHILKGDDVEDTIESFIVGNKMEWLAIAKRKRNFFDLITSKSLTNKLHHHSYVPLLVFHTAVQSGTPLF
ncbi:MAG: universal stress protein [Bacteroidota bacterium]